MASFLETISNIDTSSITNYKDYRLKENRAEGFVKSFIIRRNFNDFDSYLIKNIYKRKNYNNLEKLWFSLWYGFSENVIFSYIMVEKWGDFSNCYGAPLEKWLYEDQYNGMITLNRLRELLKNKSDKFSFKLGNMIRSIIKEVKSVSNSLFQHIKKFPYDCKETIRKIPCMKQDINVDLMLYAFSWVDVDYINFKYSDSNYIAKQGIAYLLGYDSLIYSKTFSKNIENILSNYMYDLFDKYNKFELINHLVLYRDIFNGKNNFIKSYTKYTPNYLCVISYIHALNANKLFPEFDWSIIFELMKSRNKFGLSSYASIYTKIPNLTGMILGLHYNFKEDVDVYKELKIVYPNNTKIKGE